VLWLKLAPYLLAAALLAGGGIWVDRHRHSVDETAFKAQWTARDLAETQAKDAALAAQKAHAAEDDARNQEQERKLNDAAKQAQDALRDRDLARRLLSAARATPAGGAVSPSAGQLAASSSSPSAGDAGAGQLLGLVTDAITECRRTADEWDALQAELTPQLGGTVQNPPR
jgi:hypothetical protein